MTSPEEDVFRESVIEHCIPLDPLFQAVSKRYDSMENDPTLSEPRRVYRKTPLVAGGAMRSIYNISQGEEDTIKDFDIYFPNPEMYNDALVFCTDNYEPAKQHKEAKNLAFVIKPGVPPVQLIQEYYVNGITELFESFDWTCVMAAYNGSYTMMHQDFMSSNDDGELRLPFDEGHYILKKRGPVELISRAMKYASKGYFLPLETIMKIVNIARQTNSAFDDIYSARLNS